jgi:hypothetical protein
MKNKSWGTSLIAVSQLEEFSSPEQNRIELNK